MTTFTPPSISNYNATPPADDGSQVAANRVDWSKIKTKLSDPIKTAYDSLASGLSTAFGTLFNPTTATPVAADKLLFLDASDSDNIKGATISTILAVRSAAPVGRGCGISNNTLDANNDIDFATGFAADLTNNRVVRVTTALTKRLDAVWAAGTNQGGLDAGSKNNSTWYSCWQIWKEDDTTDAIFSTAAPTGSPTLPTGYLYKEYLGSVLTDGSGNIRAFKQSRDRKWFRWVTGIDDASTTYGTTSSTVTGSGPANSTLLYVARAYKAASAVGLRIFATDETDSALNASSFPMPDINNTTDGGTAQLGYRKGQVALDSSRQFKVIANNAGSDLVLTAIGYIDHNIGA